MWRWTSLILWGVLAACGGCVLVDTPDVRIGVIGSPHPRQHDVPGPTTSYARVLQRVIRQHDKVAKELNDRDWDDLLDETGDWVEYVQELSGYADSSHDPARFRQSCDQLLSATRAVRRAARARDPGRCARALDACDPLLDQLARTFPLTEPPTREDAEGTNSGPGRVP